MEVVSNRRFEAGEFARWRKGAERDGHVIGVEEIERVRQRLEEARKRGEEWDVDRMLENAEGVNVTYVRTQMEMKYQVAKRTYEEEMEMERQNKPSNVQEAREIMEKLESDLGKLDELKRRKEEAARKKNSIGDYNSKAQRSQIEEDRKRSELIQKKQKTGVGFDAFSTISCAPQILWDTQNKKNQLSTIKAEKEAKALELKKRDSKAAEKLSEEAKLTPHEKQKTEFEKAIDRRNAYLARVQKVDLKISSQISSDPTDFSRYPAASKTPSLAKMNPILKAKLEEKQKAELEKETRKIYTLDEYLTKIS